jgi:malonyl CoA-acyl carrier protein transacylase/NAD(P)-dependent dehydrogenase (short-subunit alcohol dehydrogenase family)
MCDLAMIRILDRLGISPDMMAGHSYGEMVALCHAGAWSESDLLDLSAARAHAILEAAGDDPGAMVAANVGAERLEPLVADIDGVVLANHNAPNQTILSGPTPEIELAVEKLEKAEIRATRLPVACAFHSGVVADAQPAFRQVLDRVPTGPLTAEVWSNTTAGRYPSDPDGMQDLLSEQLAQPVLFAEQIEAMYEAGARTFVEVGPGRVLSGLVDRTLGDRPYVSVPTDVKGEPGIVRFLCALGQLAVMGIKFDTEALFMDRGADRFDLEAPPERAYPPLSWLVDGHYARPVEGELPDGALKPVMEPPVPATPHATPGPEPQTGTGDAAVLEYLRNIRDLAEAQRQVMLSYIGRPVTELPAAAAVEATPAIPAPAPTTPEEVAAPSPAPATVAPSAETTVEPVTETKPLSDVLLEIVSARTGYPQEMLDLDLDLEADLSIDSIKRIEILGILNEEIGLADELGDNRDELLEELASLKTLRGIQLWIEERVGSPSEAGGMEPPEKETEVVEAGQEPSSNGTSTEASPEEESVERFRVEVRSAPLSDRNGLDVRGKTFVLTDDGNGLAGALSDLLTERGADVRIAGPGEEIGAFDGLVHLAPIATSSGPEDVKALFGLAQRATEDGAQWVFGVTGMGGTLGRDGNGDAGVQGGVAGVLKSLAKEWPNGTVRAIDLDTREDRTELAERLLAELMTEDDRLEVGYANGDRQGVEVVPAPFDDGTKGSALALDGESVVLVTGGARGITARVSEELARRFGCRLELVGRSPLPSTEESPETAGIEDPLDLKKKVIELHPDARPANIEDLTRRILAGREIRTSLASIEAAGGTSRYHSVDVRDATGFGDLIDQLYEEHGQLDGVIHAAGLIEDKLLSHKTKESFDRVFDTKVSGALTLAGKLREDVRFIVFFSSVAGLFGNRGQTDYAAANDLLDKLAHQLNRQLPARVVSVNWGPWDTAGMVSPELRREYRRRGIGLIPLGEGVERLLQEITSGPPDDAQIVIMSATSASLP